MNICKVCGGAGCCGVLCRDCKVTPCPYADAKDLSSSKIDRNWVCKSCNARQLAQKSARK